MEVRLVDASTTHALRASVLGAVARYGTAVFDGDDAPGAFHVGAFEDERVVGVASWLPTRTGAQLRGMAVDPEFRDRGVGTALLDFSEGELRARGATRLWADARTSALGFYERTGWTPEGDEFDKAGIPHVVVTRELS